MHPMSPFRDQTEGAGSLEAAPYPGALGFAHVPSDYATPFLEAAETSGEQEDLRESEAEEPGKQPISSGSLSSARLRWRNASADELAFMKAVYDRHAERSRQRGGSFVTDPPEDHLGPIEKKHKARKDAAQAAVNPLAEARTALAAEGLADKVHIGIVSAYRPATAQFEIWQGLDRKGGFPYYYRQAVTNGVVKSSDFGAAAVDRVAQYVGQYIASPGYSNHQDGLAIDFGTGAAGKGLGVIGTRAWFHRWLVANAARFGFRPYAKEAWHWTYRATPGSGSGPGSGAAAAPVAARRIEIARDRMLAAHRGEPPDLVLRWNEIVQAPAELDVVVHLHGHSRAGLTLPRDIEPWSGLDLGPVDGAVGRGRTRPTVTVLPRGHDTGQRTKVGLNRYTFPAFGGRDGLQQLVSFALERVGAQAGGAPPNRGRLILSAHSGGADALLPMLGYHDPHEVHVFDGLYQDPAPLAEWAVKRIRRDRAALESSAASLRAYMPVHGGALRVFYGPGTRAFSRRLRDTSTESWCPPRTGCETSTASRRAPSLSPASTGRSRANMAGASSQMPAPTSRMPVASLPGIRSSRSATTRSLAMSSSATKARFSAMSSPQTNASCSATSRPRTSASCSATKTRWTSWPTWHPAPRAGSRRSRTSCATRI
jgi:LAS superfamily LD-carboxypeptidase LdcB